MSQHSHSTVTAQSQHSTVTAQSPHPTQPLPAGLAWHMRSPRRTAQRELELARQPTKHPKQPIGLKRPSTVDGLCPRHPTPIIHPNRQWTRATPPPLPARSFINPASFRPRASTDVPARAPDHFSLRDNREIEHRDTRTLLAITGVNATRRVRSGFPRCYSIIYGTVHCILPSCGFMCKSISVSMMQVSGENMSTYYSSSSACCSGVSRDVEQHCRCPRRAVSCDDVPVYGVHVAGDP